MADMLKVFLRKFLREPYHNSAGSCVSIQGTFRGDSFNSLFDRLKKICTSIAYRMFCFGVHPNRDWGGGGGSSLVRAGSFQASNWSEPAVARPLIGPNRQSQTKLSIRSKKVLN